MAGMHGQQPGILRQLLGGEGGGGGLPSPVGAAAAWPVLLLGVAFPKIATLVVAFVPLSKHAPSWIIRLVWLALALAVPLVVGSVVASKAPPGTPREPAMKRLLRGFPVTLG